MVLVVYFAKPNQLQYAKKGFEKVSFVVVVVFWGFFLFLFLFVFFATACWCVCFVLIRMMNIIMYLCHHGHKQVWTEACYSQGNRN